MRLDKELSKVLTVFLELFNFKRCQLQLLLNILRPPPNIRHEVTNNTKLHPVGKGGMLTQPKDG